MARKESYRRRMRAARKAHRTNLRNVIMTKNSRDGSKV